MKIFLIIISAVSFLFCSFIYIKKDNHDIQKAFNTHVAIIANDVWAFNLESIKAYLQLALTAHHYQDITVSIPGNKEYLQLTNSPTGPYFNILKKLHLIQIKNLQKDIVYNNQIIGTLYGYKFILVIFPILNILLIHLLFALTAIVISQLIIRRKFLEKEVARRTVKLRDSERRFHELVDLLPEMVFETDITGAITYANKVALEVFNLSEYTNGKVYLFDLFPENVQTKINIFFNQTIKGEQTDLAEINAVDNFDRLFPVLIRFTPVWQDKVIAGTRSIVIDISERKQMETELRKDQNMKAIGLMAGGVAHDLNNILSSVVSYPELLLLNIPDASPLWDPLHKIHQAGIKAGEVVSDLLTVARGIVVEPDIKNPNLLIQDYINTTDFQHMIQEFPLVTFNTNLFPNLDNIACSPIHIHKCLMNLVRNGAESIQGKGKLTITTENKYLTREDLTKIHFLSQPGKYVKIIVSDTGSGINNKDLQHIFEPFYTTKKMGQSGTGLGLAVVWNTMRDHKGAVCVSSSSKETVFELYFPSISDEINDSDSASQPLTLTLNKGNKESILVVDDEVEQRTLTKKILTRLNYTVNTVESGEEAILFLQQQPVNLVILDMLMHPDQYNGRQTYKKILEYIPNQKALIISGYAENNDVKRTLDMGAGGFLAKPYTIEQISRAVKNILAP